MIRVDKCGAPSGILRASMLIVAGAMALACGAQSARGQSANFGPSNPLYSPSALPYHAPPFDRLKDADYQPAIEAGMAEQLKEIAAIANNRAAATFENTIVAMEKTGRLLDRATSDFDAVTGANIDPQLQKVKDIEAPKLAAHEDAIFLDAKLFQRVAAIYKQRNSLKLDPESLRLVDFYYKKFVHSGANLSDADKAKLKKLNEEESTLSDEFIKKLIEGTKDGAFATTDKEALAGLSEAQLAAAAQSAKDRKRSGYVIPLQNTTQQPDFDVLSARSTRKTIFENSWNRTERGGANDTRATIARMAQIRAEKAKLLGFPNYAAWKLEDQMAKTPEAALKFINALVAPSTAKAVSEAK
ncbi:MAG: M3 family metallopeptidase, partial [Terracidiphilus sp.]